MVEKDELGSFVALAIQLVAASIAWLQNLGIITVLISVTLGSTLTLIVQSRTQRRAWKREASLQKIDSIYGPLYEENEKIFRELHEEGLALSNYLRTEKWDSIKSTYRYFLVDTQLRRELEEFYQLVNDLDNNNRRVWSNVDPKFLRNLQEALGKEIQGHDCKFTLHLRTGGTSEISAEVYRSILSGQHPLDRAKQIERPDVESYEMKILLLRSGTYVLLPDEMMNKFNEVIQRTISEIRDDSETKRSLDLHNRLISLTIALQRKLQGIIEEPWKI